MAEVDKVTRYKRADGKWAWHRVNEHSGDVTSTDGGQGYENEDDCFNAAYKQFGDTVDYVRADDIDDPPK